MKVKITHATGDLEYQINIDLQLKQGFGKGLSSLANVTLKSANEVVDVRHIENIENNNRCKICKPELIFYKPDNRIVLAGVMQQDDICLMTSEYVKMISYADERGQIWFTSNAQEQVPLGGLSPDQHLKWQCSAGKFVGPNTGRSVIYFTPDESELSKSPVTITLQEEDGRTIASRGFWLLRGSSVMHC